MPILLTLPVAVFFDPTAQAAVVAATRARPDFAEIEITVVPDPFLAADEAVLIEHGNPFMRLVIEGDEIRFTLTGADLPDVLCVESIDRLAQSFHELK